MSEPQTVYLVRDQHGHGHTVHFTLPEDAQAYAARCSEPAGPLWKPDSYIVIPVPVWGSLAQRDAAPE